jgi:hypothetical protein
MRVIPGVLELAVMLDQPLMVLLVNGIAEASVPLKPFLAALLLRRITAELRRQGRWIDPFGTSYEPI